MHKWAAFIITLTAILYLGPYLHASTVVEPWYAPTKLREDPQYDDATLEKLKATKLSVKWDGVTLKEALDELTLRSKQADPTHEGITFTPDPSLGIQKVKVSMLLTNASLDDILGYLQGHVSFTIKVHKGEVLLLPSKRL